MSVGYVVPGAAYDMNAWRARNSEVRTSEEFFALPMIMSNPNYSKTTKIVISTIVIAVTISLCVAMIKLYSYLLQTIQSLGL